jgi:nitroreductase
VEGRAREQLGELLAEAVQLQGADVTQAALDKARAMPLRAPLVVVVVARLQEHFKVPKSEQLLAAGCAAHGILLAAYAQGIGAVWRTGELSYSAHVAKGLGLEAGEEIIAFLYLGTPLNEPRVAPKEDTAAFVSAWSGAN